MPRTLTAKLIQLPFGTVERDASILSNATQRNATDLVPFSIEIIIPERNRNEFVRTRGGDRSYTHHIGHAFDHSVSFHRFPRTDEEERRSGAHTCDLIGSFNNGVTHAPSLLCFVAGEQMTAGSRGGRALPPREGSSIVTDR